MVFNKYPYLNQSSHNILKDIVNRKFNNHYRFINAPIEKQPLQLLYPGYKLDQNYINLVDEYGGYPERFMPRDGIIQHDNPIDLELHRIDNKNKSNKAQHDSHLMDLYLGGNNKIVPHPMVEPEALIENQIFTGHRTYVDPNLQPVNLSKNINEYPDNDQSLILNNINKDFDGNIRLQQKLGNKHNLEEENAVGYYDKNNDTQTVTDNYNYSNIDKYYKENIGKHTNFNNNYNTQIKSEHYETNIENYDKSNNFNNHNNKKGMVYNNIENYTHLQPLTSHPYYTKNKETNISNIQDRMAVTSTVEKSQLVSKIEGDLNTIREKVREQGGINSIIILLLQDVLSYISHLNKEIHLHFKDGKCDGRNVFTTDMIDISESDSDFCIWVHQTYKSAVKNFKKFEDFMYNVLLKVRNLELKRLANKLVYEIHDELDVLGEKINENIQKFKDSDIPDVILTELQYFEQYAMGILTAIKNDPDLSEKAVNVLKTIKDKLDEVLDYIKNKIDYIKDNRTLKYAIKRIIRGLEKRLAVVVVSIINSTFIEQVKHSLNKLLSKMIVELEKFKTYIGVSDIPVSEIESNINSIVKKVMESQPSESSQDIIPQSLSQPKTSKKTDYTWLYVAAIVLIILVLFVCFGLVASGDQISL